MLRLLRVVEGEDDEDFVQLKVVGVIFQLVYLRYDF